MELNAEILGALLDSSELYRPIVQKAAAAIKSYGPEIKDLFSGIALGLADIKIETIKKYEDAGFTRDEAISLVQDEWYAIGRAIRHNNAKK
jgi:hypothetical protein